MSEEGVAVTAPGGQEGLTVRGRKREEWSSRWAFYFAAVGAAVGFGKFDGKYEREASAVCLPIESLNWIILLSFTR